MVDGEGKSHKALETTKRSIEILLEEIAYVRDQVDHQNIKWETHDLQDVQDELSMTHGKLAQFKMSLLMLSRRVDGLEDLKEQVKSLTMSYSGIEDLAEERHSEYMLRFTKLENRTSSTEEEIAVLKEQVAALTKVQSSPTSEDFKSQVAQLEDVKSQVAI